MTATPLARPTSPDDWQRLIAGVGHLVARRLHNRADVDDVVQEVLLRVWRHRGALRSDERFGAWLGRIVRTAAADHLRGRRRHPPAPAERAPGSGTSEVHAVDEDGEPHARTVITGVLRPFVQDLP